MHYQRPCANMTLCARLQWQVLHLLHLGDLYAAALGNGPGRTHWIRSAALATCAVYVYPARRMPVVQRVPN